MLSSTKPVWFEYHFKPSRHSRHSRLHLTSTGELFKGMHRAPGSGLGGASRLFGVLGIVLGLLQGKPGTLGVVLGMR